MAGLNQDQYQAALQNINALRALADSACESIGKTASSVTDELESMQDGLNDILDYVMDMLKHRINDQIDALEDIKDQYQALIDLKKESLEASKDEADYEKSVAKQLKEIAKLQARIDALSLDDSREAQAEKASLLEELAELQETLNDDQAEHAIEAQEDALDAQYDAYEQEKDAEIAVLEDSISSTEKLYRMAISYIEENWSTLKDELIQWNYDVGNSLESEMLSAWDAAYAAAQRYGSYVSALNSIGADIESASTSGQSYVVGETNNEDYIHAIIKQMYANAQAWHTASDSQKASLDEANLRLGTQLAQYGVNAYRSNGTWYVDNGELLFEKYKKYIYHGGGFVGEEGTIKDNEILAKLEKGETVLTARMWDNLATMIERMEKMSSAFSALPDFIGGSILADTMKQSAGAGSISNITNNSQPVEISIGDTIIQGNASAETVAQHVKVTRDMVNQIAKIVGLKL